ncbi:hypothetical protein PR048_021813 [Dryococelus australis]|uniref:Uncharacterized protein n=1 Tax=Dryococelus australis TaxID=614101 RepID=A0ABQ9GZ93_9NEOP|nr:hypothetical protein PR048_021813 [Dryococelus australis]
MGLLRGLRSALTHWDGSQRWGEGNGERRGGRERKRHLNRRWGHGGVIVGQLTSHHGEPSAHFIVNSLESGSRGINCQFELVRNVADVGVGQWASTRRYSPNNCSESLLRPRLQLEPLTPTWHEELSDYSRPIHNGLTENLDSVAGALAMHCTLLHKCRHVHGSYDTSEDADLITPVVGGASSSIGDWDYVRQVLHLHSQPCYSRLLHPSTTHCLLARLRIECTPPACRPSLVPRVVLAVDVRFIISRCPSGGVGTTAGCSRSNCVDRRLRENEQSTQVGVAVDISGSEIVWCLRPSHNLPLSFPHRMIMFENCCTRCSSTHYEGKKRVTAHRPRCVSHTNVTPGVSTRAHRNLGHGCSWLGYHPQSYHVVCVKVVHDKDNAHILPTRLSVLLEMFNNFPGRHDLQIFPNSTTMFGDASGMPQQQATILREAWWTRYGRQRAGPRLAARTSNGVSLFCFHSHNTPVVIMEWNGEILAALNTEILRVDEGEVRWVWSSVGMQGRRKREISEKTRKPAASSGTSPTCKNPGATPPGIEPNATQVGGEQSNHYTTAALRSHRKGMQEKIRVADGGLSRGTCIAIRERGTDTNNRLRARRSGRHLTPTRSAARPPKFAPVASSRYALSVFVGVILLSLLKKPTTRDAGLSAVFDESNLAECGGDVRYQTTADEVKRNEYVAATEYKGGGKGDPRENPPNSRIVRHDSHMRKSRSDQAGNRTGSDIVRGERSFRCIYTPEDVQLMREICRKPFIQEFTPRLPERLRREEAVVQQGCNTGERNCVQLQESNEATARDASYVINCTPPIPSTPPPRGKLGRPAPRLLTTSLSTIAPREPTQRAAIAYAFGTTVWRNDKCSFYSEQPKGTRRSVAEGHVDAARDGRKE